MRTTALPIFLGLTTGLFLALTVGLAGSAMADGEISLRTIAQQEITVVNEAGEKETKIVEAAKVVPGDVVIYTITAKNTSDQGTENLVINDPVPEHMTYVPGSAEGAGTAIVYSADGGKSFAAESELVVKNEDGTERAAEAKDYTHIRWTLKNPLEPAQTASVSFRARLN